LSIEQLTPTPKDCMSGASCFKEFPADLEMLMYISAKHFLFYHHNRS